MSDLHDLYQEVILDHNKHPRNFGALSGATHQAEGFNPLCGDKVAVRLILNDDVVEEIRFEGRGCAISTASASLLTETVQGKSRKEIDDLFAGFHALVTGDLLASTDTELGKLEVFSGVAEYPMRVKCASLCWHTLRAAMDNESEPVTTE